MVGGGGGDGGLSPENAHGKMHLHLHIWRTCRIPEERTNTGCGNRSRGRIQQGSFKLLMDLPVQHGVGLTLTPLDCRRST